MQGFLEYSFITYLAHCVRSIGINRTITMQKNQYMEFPCVSKFHLDMAGRAGRCTRARDERRKGGGGWSKRRTSKVAFLAADEAAATFPSFLPG